MLSFVGWQVASWRLFPAALLSATFVVLGLLAPAVVKAVRNYLDTHDVSLPRGVKLTADDIREGVVAICSVFVHEPQFQGQTKERLNSRDAVKLVSTFTRPPLELWLNQHVEYGRKLAVRFGLQCSASPAHNICDFFLPRRRTLLPKKDHSV